MPGLLWSAIKLKTITALNSKYVCICWSFGWLVLVKWSLILIVHPLFLQHIKMFDVHDDDYDADDGFYFEEDHIKYIYLY